MKVDVFDITKRQVELPLACPKCGADFSDREASNLRVLPLETGSSERGWIGTTPEGHQHIEIDTESADGGERHGSAAYSCAACDHTLVRGRVAGEEDPAPIYTLLRTVRGAIEKYDRTKDHRNHDRDGDCIRCRIAAALEGTAWVP